VHHGLSASTIARGCEVGGRAVVPFSRWTAFVESSGARPQRDLSLMFDASISRHGIRWRIWRTRMRWRTRRAWGGSLSLRGGGRQSVSALFAHSIM